MKFTREPIIETVITPKEGNKLVVRNSKGGAQEEFFVDAVEVVSFGNSCFFRSLEKPKSFLVPVNDYEILEVREARMPLKTAAIEKTAGIKIGGGREAPVKAQKEESPIEEVIAEQKVDKRRERRRYRKKRGKAEQEEDEVIKQEPSTPEKRAERPSLIPPPSTLISETLTKHKITPVPIEPIVEEEQAQENSEEDEEIPF